MPGPIAADRGASETVSFIEQFVSKPTLRASAGLDDLRNRSCKALGYTDANVIQNKEDEIRERNTHSKRKVRTYTHKERESE